MVTCLAFLLPLVLGRPRRRPADLALPTAAPQTSAWIQTTFRFWLTGSGVASKVLQLLPCSGHWSVGHAASGLCLHTQQRQEMAPGAAHQIQLLAYTLCYAATTPASRERAATFSLYFYLSLRKLPQEFILTLVKA